MEYILILLVSAAGWGLGYASPLRTPNSSPESTSAAKENQKTISDIILSANKHVTRPLRGGDMAVRLGRSARICDDCRWDMENGVVTVPFVISSEYAASDTKLIRSALAEFSSMTCVQFVDRVSETNFISIENRTGCWSYIGRSMAAQTLSLQTPKCMSYGVVQHETMHALSFFHEHSRMDRDKYVDIMWQYISPQNQGDFKVENGQKMDIPYNYNSIMHYSRNTFSNTSGMPSIVPKPDPSVFIGQRNGLSALDVVMINRFYDCNLCRTKILGTSGSFSSSDASPSKANDNCLWLIHVVSFKVYLQLNFFTPSSDDCSDHIIVYDGVNKTSPVLVNISLNQPPPVLISSGVFMLVEYIADKSCSNSFSASYRTVSFGRTYTSSTGSVLSQKHPSNYPNNIKDTSIIIAPPGYKVSLTFALIDLELSPDCANDYLVLRDGGNTNSPIIGKYCGQKNKFRLLSSERMVLFQFSSNSSISRQGYRANYSFVLSK